MCLIAMNTIVSRLLPLCKEDLKYLLEIQQIELLLLQDGMEHHVTDWFGMREHTGDPQGRTSV